MLPVDGLDLGADGRLDEGAERAVDPRLDGVAALIPGSVADGAEIELAELAVAADRLETSSVTFGSKASAGSWPDRSAVSRRASATAGSSLMVSWTRSG